MVLVLLGGVQLLATREMHAVWKSGLQFYAQSFHVCIQSISFWLPVPEMKKNWSVTVRWCTWLLNQSLWKAAFMEDCSFAAAVKVCVISHSWCWHLRGKFVHVQLQQKWHASQKNTQVFGFIGPLISSIRGPTHAWVFVCSYFMHTTCCSFLFMSSCSR